MKYSILALLILLFACDNKTSKQRLNHTVDAYFYNYITRFQLNKDSTYQIHEVSMCFGNYNHILKGRYTVSNDTITLSTPEHEIDTFRGEVVYKFQESMVYYTNKDIDNIRKWLYFEDSIVCINKKRILYKNPDMPFTSTTYKLEGAKIEADIDLAKYNMSLHPERYLYQQFLEANNMCKTICDK